MQITELNCEQIHKLANSLPRYDFRFRLEDIPENGIYFFFEKGEIYKGMDRIVRIGTHTGENQLRSRIQQHLIKGNKDRSIFLKNIGRAFLNRDNDEFLEQWDWDLTSRENRKKYSGRVDLEKVKKIEALASNYLRQNFTFSAIPVETKEERLKCEAYLIKTVSSDAEFGPSDNWLGKYSPAEKIRKSGLWQVQKVTI